MSGHVDIDGDPLTVLSVTGEYNGAALMGNVIDNIVTFDPSQLADVLGAGEVADVTLNYTWTDGKTESSGYIRLNVIGDAAVSASTEFADRLVGSNHDDSIDSLSGNDYVYALAGDDVVVAGAGRDHVFGGDGNDVIYGDAGSDKIYGQSGVDLMFGGQGDDILNGGAGNDWLIGGDGSDSFVFEVDRDEVTAAEVDNIFDWQTGQDTLLFDLGKLDSDVNFDFGAINLLDYATVFSGYVEIDVQSLMFNEIGLLSNAHTVNVYGINGQSDLDYLSHSFNFVV
jgi:Ca2+-binding RTX toxin-like protein